MKYFWFVLLATIAFFTVLILGGFNVYHLLGAALYSKRNFVLAGIFLTISAAGLDALGHYCKFNARDAKGDLKNRPACYDNIILTGKLVAAIGIIAFIMTRAEDVSGISAGDLPLEIQNQYNDS